MASRFLVPFGGGRSLLGRGDPFLELHREVNRLFDDAFRGMGGQAGQGSALISAPRMDVHEVDNGLEITAEIPGVSQDDIDLRIDGDVLTLRGEKRNERQDAQAHITERSYGSFQRSLQLPFEPQPDQVHASFENGVLRVTLPRPAQQEKSRRIEIRGSQGAGAQGGQETGTGASASAGGGEQSQSGEGAESRSAIGGPAWTGGENHQGGGEEAAGQRQDSEAKS